VRTPRREHSPGRARPGAGWAAAGLALAAVGVALRVNNALDFPLDKGFDAVAKWEYVALLMTRWTLPAPDAFWSAAHPPLFYALAAAIGRALGSPEKAVVVTAVRLIGSACGLLLVGLAVALARRWQPESPRRAFLAALLLLFLPVHVYTSAMLGEELLVAAWVSLCVVGVAWDLAEGRPHPGPGRAALFGLLGGLALLTKPTGALALAAGAGAYLLDGVRRGDLGGGALRALALGGAGAAVGGWFYLRNWIGWGYLYPHGLEIHAIMYRVPPGERGLADYLYVPLATWAHPHLLHPDLLRSVWGSTYVTLWFEPHRHFLPQHGAELLRLGRWLLALGVLPTAAFVYGAARAWRRARARAGGPDAPLLLLTALFLLGYALFTWRNPYYVTIKAGYLLSLCVPFAWFASDGLAVWTTRLGRWGRALVWLDLALLALLCTALFWHGALFAKLDPPGTLPWR